MFKKWIDEIRNQTDLYSSDCWKYHLSGNAVEISIAPAYLKKKKLYRCSVIAAGQVLQALAKKTEEKHINYHIQSFPNIENPAIVASIRTDQKGTFIYKNDLFQVHSANKISINNSLKNLAGLYKFKLKEVDHPFDIGIDVKIPLEKYKKWLVLYSAQNNPFTWLHVGYVKESLNNLSLDSANDSYYIFDLCLLSMHKYLNLQISENEYAQILVGMQPANSPTR